jgi:hypothetical protein
MHSAIVLNRFRPFGGIDCHSVFTEILSTLQGMSSPVVVASSVSSPLAGWEYVESTYLYSLPALSPGGIVRYFDGAVPTWPHAVSAAIPRRQAVSEITENLAKVVKDDTARSMHLIRAAGGEGKSTVLLQAAADLARASGWSVLWRSSPNEGISPEQVADLDPTRRWLLVADDADNIISGLVDSAFYLSQSGRTGVHFLLASRDADWRNARGAQKPWAAWLTPFPDIILRGITPEDAKAVVIAWEQFGGAGLGALSSVGDTAQRIAAFESAVSSAETTQAKQQKQRSPQDGSFFGGLLAVRFGQNGLQAHVRDFLQRLQNMRIERGKSSLFDALLYVAACHGTGIPGIDELVLADLVGVPREWVQRLVVRPLGEEAAAVHSAGHVLTRHSQVAAAILVETEETLEIDLAEVFRILVSTTAKVGRDIHFGDASFPRTIHAGPHLQRALPQQISEGRRKAIAVAAAKAFISAEPERLSGVTDLGRTYRNAEMMEQAVETFRDNLDSIGSKVDFDSNIRGYWYEWGVCEGIAGNTAEHHAAGAWLQGLSLSDHLNPAQITTNQGKLSCAGLGVAFGKLLQPAPDCPYAKARRAVTFLGRRFGYDVKADSYFDRHDHEADELGTPYPRDVPEAIAWLTAGVAQAGRELQDHSLKTLLGPVQVSFDLLWTTLEPDSFPNVLRAQSSKPSAPLDMTRWNNQLQQMSNQHEDRIQAGIERVINEAWKAVPPDTAPEQRFQLAIQKAGESISRLSPHIKRQVRAHFQTNNWEPLKSREPKP